MPIKLESHVLGIRIKSQHLPVGCDIFLDASSEQCAIITNEEKVNTYLYNPEVDAYRWLNHYRGNEINAKDLKRRRGPFMSQRITYIEPQSRKFTSLIAKLLLRR